MGKLSHGPDRQGPGPAPRPGRVIVVGSVNLDLVFRVPRLPGPGETVSGGTLARHHGGKGANQAVAAARAGAAVHLTGAVGADDGAGALAALAAEGVDTAAVARLPGVPTGHAAIVVDHAGENLIAVAPGANAAVTAVHVRRRLTALTPTTRDVLVLSFELPDPPLLAAATAARRAGARLLINPAPARDCDPRLLRAAILTPNHRELGALLAALLAAPPAADPGEAAADLARRTRGPVIVTMGPGGALLADAGTVTRFPAPRVRAVDTTGAGDTLTGTLAAGLADGSGLPAALRRAVTAAALSVTRPGARAGMPRRAEVDALLSALASGTAPAP